MAMAMAKSGYVPLMAALASGIVAKVNLFTNDITPDADSVASDFIPPEYEGYAPISLRNWTPPSMPAGRAVTTADPVYFTWTAGPAPLPIRGIWVVEPESGLLIAAGRFSGDGFPLGPSHPVLALVVTLILPPP